MLHVRSKVSYFIFFVLVACKPPGQLDGEFVGGSFEDPPTIESHDCTSVSTEDTAYSCTIKVKDENEFVGDVVQLQKGAADNCSWLEVAGTYPNFSLIGVPNNGHVGICTLHFNAKDSGDNESDSVLIPIVVTNSPSNLSLTPVGVPKNSLLAPITDPTADDEGQGATAQYSLIAATQSPECAIGVHAQVATTINSATGQITFQPFTGFTGTCYLGLQFDDGNGSVSTADLEVIISDASGAPSIVSHDCGNTGTEDTSYSCTITVTDPDIGVNGDTVSIERDGTDNCTWLTASGAYPTFTISGTPINTDVGTCDLKFFLKDSFALVSPTESINLTTSNTASTLNILDVGVVAGSGANVIVDANAEDEGQVQASVTAPYELEVPSGGAGVDCHNNATIRSVSNIDPFQGTITFSPRPEFQGTCFYRLKFTERDTPSVVSVTKEFKVTVSPSGANFYQNFTVCPFDTNNNITFTRSSVGTYFDSNGILQTAANDTPRCNHDPVTKEPLGLLVEESRTNFVIESDASSGSAGTLPTNWTDDVDAGLTVSYDVQNSSQFTGQKYVDVDVNNSSGSIKSTRLYFNDFTNNIPVSQGETYTITVFIKRIAGGFEATPGGSLGFHLHDSGSSYIGEDHTSFATSGAPGTKYVRYSHTYTVAAGVSFLSPRYRHYNIPDGLSYIIRFAAPQVEQGTFATSYISTSGATVTRERDIASAPTADWYNSNASTVLVNWNKLDPLTDQSFSRPFAIHDGTSDNILEIIFQISTLKSFFNVVLSGAFQGLGIGSSTAWSTLGERRLSGMAISTNNARASESGTLVGTDSTIQLPGTVNTVNFGTAQNGFSEINGHITQFFHWAERKSDADLDALTTNNVPAPSNPCFTVASVNDAYQCNPEGPDVDNIDLLHWYLDPVATTCAWPTLAIDPKTGVITGTPDVAVNCDISYRLSDGYSSGSQTVSLTVSP